MTRGGLPKGRRWLQVTRDTWEAWLASDGAATWTDAERLEAQALIFLVDDLHRTTAPTTRLKLAHEIRQATKALRIHRGPTSTKEDTAQKRRMEYLEAQRELLRREDEWRYGVTDYERHYLDGGGIVRPVLHGLLETDAEREATRDAGEQRVKDGKFGRPVELLSPPYECECWTCQHENKPLPVSQ